MLLEQLLAYARVPEVAAELPPVGYAPRRVKWLITLSLDGKCRYLMNTATAGKGKESRGIEIMIPDLVRTSGIAPRLLADTASYVLGIAEPCRKERAAEQHRAFVEAVRSCLSATGHPYVAAVLRFLEGLPDTWNGNVPEDIAPADNVTFEVEGQLVVDLPEVRAYWAEVRRAEAEKGQPERICLVCKQRRPVMEIMPVAIQGVPGTNPSGAALISANCDAFEPYGMKGAHHAPLCFNCAERTHRGLNHLLASRRNTWRGQKLVYTAWTTGEENFDLMALLAKPDPHVVVELLKSLGSGKQPVVGGEAERLYALALSGNVARVVIRDWLDTTVPEIKRRVARFFALQRLVDVEGGYCPPVGIYALARATERTDEKKPFIDDAASALFRSVLHGYPLPEMLLYKAVQRIRQEQSISRVRAILIKMVLTEKLGLEEDALVSLDPNRPEAAYHCGRLLAVYERLQEAANNSSNLVSRYFGLASTAPAAGFASLNRLAQAHLAKLNRQGKRVVARAIEAQIMEIKARIGEMPTALTIGEQGLFDLGYWHQRAFDREQAVARSRMKRLQESGESESEPLADENELASIC